MNQNKKNLIIGMCLFLFVFLIYVVYYESINLDVEYNSYYVNYNIRKKMYIDEYKILGIVTNEREYHNFINEYDLYDYEDKDFRNNYLYVAVKEDESTGGYIEFNKMKKVDGRYQILFKNHLQCDYYNSDEIQIYEFEISKHIIDTGLFEVIINCDDSELDYCLDDFGNMEVKKPVLYLYPDKDMKVNVTFDNKNNLLSTYPKYKDKWSVMAKTDGTLIDDNGREYYALYWDESIKHKEKFETGFYVKSEDSIKFLEEKLFEMGFTDKEANEFIMYWLPIMEQGGDNLVHFHFTEDRQKQNKINIEPKVDSLFRVSIEIKKVNEEVSIKEQKIEKFERYGFSALEWGGSIIK